MALPTDNVTQTLGMDQVQTEFGGINPISMSEYYRGGANVPSVSLSGAVQWVTSAYVEGVFGIAFFVDTSTGGIVGTPITVWNGVTGLFSVMPSVPALSSESPQWPLGTALGTDGIWYGVESFGPPDTPYFGTLSIRRRALRQAGYKWETRDIVSGGGFVGLVYLSYGVSFLVDTVTGAESNHFWFHADDGLSDLNSFPDPTLSAQFNRPTILAANGNYYSIGDAEAAFPDTTTGVTNLVSRRRKISKAIFRDGVTLNQTVPTAPLAGAPNPSISLSNFYGTQQG